MSNARRRPSIYQIGQATDDGREVVISGWGLGLCMAGCRCHAYPATGQLHLYMNDATGDLGLMKQGPCDCCQPWTPAELLGIVRFLRVLERVPVR